MQVELKRPCSLPEVQGWSAAGSWAGCMAVGAALALTAGELAAASLDNIAAPCERRRA